MSNTISLFLKSKTVKEYLNNLNKDKYSYFCYGVKGTLPFLLSYATFLSTNDNVIYVASNLYKANQAYQQLVSAAGLENVTLYVGDEAISTELITASSELKYERINTLRALFTNNRKIIVTDILTLLRPMVTRDEYLQHVVRIEKGKDIDVTNLILTLVRSGYQRVATTYAPGEFSVRGEVIDIFPITYLNPIRINLFDEEVEALREYDVQTQKSTKNITEAYCFPLNDFFVDDISNIEKLKKECSDELKEVIDKDIEAYQNYNSVDRMVKYIKYLKKDSSTFLDYITNKTIIFANQKDCKAKYEQAINEVYSFLVEKKISQYDLSFYHDYNILEKEEKRIYFSTFFQNEAKLELVGIYSFDGDSSPSFDNNFKYLTESLKEGKETTVLALSSIEKQSLIKEVLDEEKIKYYMPSDIYEVKANNINLVLVGEGLGFTLRGEVSVFTDENIFQKGIQKKAKYRSVIQNINTINSKDDLLVGDYIVHYDYGVGQYLGLKTVELSGIVKDYLQLRYANVEVLVPVEKITLLEKYQGSDATSPRLTKVGTNEWEKKKQTVRSQLESIARDLIETQVKRTSTTGHVFTKDSDLQGAFENDFEYEETKDQSRIIDEIKKDMEQGKMVDRLVCGDVGFGKTEIAMRIAFKTCYEGFQTAFLAPTTILCRQHYLNYKARFEKYGLKVAMINRLISDNEQKQILRDVKAGKINLLIGTHRLLSKDVIFQNLGLLIVDEEQRFGVTHKESIKKMKADVNVITLSATPIPRTLQMAVSGMRQLSVIETPPLDRYPVQTYVLEHNWTMVKEAIYREINRGGQVFYLHNRISDLDRIVRKIRDLVPEAKICFGHGRMAKEILEDTIQAFIDKEYDVLVCTTIIETGIDIPNTNTLIVDDANRLGLAQMYQVRGRVGRSDKIAYAYLTFPPDKVLTKTGTQRLDAITEYTKIGSGYKIAVRDLVIRGAGDILGREQSGFIDSVGIDMYMRLLDEAVKKLQGEEIIEEKRYKIEVNKHIEDKYVSDDAIKIYIHQTINNIDSAIKKDETKSELTDRFGRLSDDVLTYIEEIYLESLLKKFEVDILNETDNEVKAIIPQNVSNKISGKDIVMEGYKLSNLIYFEYRAKQFIIFVKKKKKIDKTWIFLMTQLLENLLKFLV